MDTRFDFASRRVPAEDLSQFPRARLDAREWEVQCAGESCGTALADASWVDIQMVMLLNSLNEGAAREAMARLPAPRFRAFRMNVRFAPGWRRDPTDGVWVHQGESEVLKSAKAAATQRRLIRGEDRVIDLRQEAETPVKAKCPACGLLQVVEGLRRKGLPGTPQLGSTEGLHLSGLRRAG